MSANASKAGPRRPLLFRPDSISHGLGVYLPASIAHRAVGFVRGVVFTWLMSRSQFGLLQIAYLTLNIMQPFCSFGLHEAIARYVPHYETRGMLRAFLAKSVPFVLLVSLLASLVVFLAAEPISRVALMPTPQVSGQADPPTTATAAQLETNTISQTEPAPQDPLTPEQATFLVQLLAGIALVQFVCMVVLYTLRGLRMFRAVSLMEVLHTLIFTVVAVAVLAAGHATAVVVLILSGGMLAVNAVLFGLPLMRIVAAAPDQGSEMAGDGKPPLRVPLQLLRFSVWSAMSLMVWHGLMYLPMWFLLKTQGPDATGILGAVRHLTQAVIIFTVAIITIVQSSIAKTWESKGHDVADRQFLLLFKMTMLLLFVLCGMGAVLSPVLVQVFPDRYAAGEVILPASLLFFLLAGQLQFLFVQFHLIERTRHIFVPLICGIVGNLMLGWLIIRPELDTTAALQATVWAGNLALTLALLVTVGLLVAERRPFDRGSLILLVAGFSIVLPGGVLVGLLLFISGLTLMTDWVMSSEEKVQIQAKATELLRRIRHAGSAESG